MRIHTAIIASVITIATGVALSLPQFSLAAEPTTTAATPDPALNQDIEESLVIEPLMESRDAEGRVVQTPIAPEPDGSFRLSKRLLVGLDPIYSFGYEERADLVVFSGQTEPTASVRLALNRAGLAKETQADAEGEWRLVVLVDELPVGEQTATIQVKTPTASSDPLIVAEFLVVAQDSISNTTWVFVMIIGLALILTLVVVNLLLLLDRTVLQRYTPPPSSNAV